MVFGDSNAYRPGNTEKSWPAILERISDHAVSVINESCDGRTTRYDTGELNGLSVIEMKIRNAKPLDFIIVALGTNDVKEAYGPPDVPAVLEGLEEIIKLVASTDGGIAPVLLTPPPMGDVANGDLAGAQDRLSSIISGYRRLAVNRSILLIDLFSVINPRRDLESDRVHLNARGRKRVANAVWASLQGAY